MSTVADDEDRALSPERAFVIRFRAGADPSGDHLPGRIDHVSSGRGMRFESSAEMFAFIRGELERAHRAAPADQPHRSSEDPS